MPGIGAGAASGVCTTGSGERAPSSYGDCGSNFTIHAS